MEDQSHDRVTLGERVQRLRKQRELMTWQFARMASMSRTYLQHIEAGSGVRRTDDLDRLAAALGIPVQELTEGIDLANLEFRLVQAPPAVESRPARSGPAFARDATRVRLASATETELLDIARGELHWLLSAVRQTQSAGTERLARVEELIRAIDLRRRDRESAASGA